MFILQSQATIEKAIERAKAVHPKVHVKAFGEYEVSGSAGNTYTAFAASAATISRRLIAHAWPVSTGRLASTPQQQLRSTATWPQH